MRFISELMVQINLNSGSGVESSLPTSLLGGVLAAPVQWLLAWVLGAVSQLAVGTCQLPCLLLSPACLACCCLPLALLPRLALLLSLM